MKRKFIFLLYMMLALSFASYSQTATIQQVSPPVYAVGDVLTLPVYVTGFTNVAAVTLGIGFDDQVLTYTGFSSPLPGALCNTTYLNGSQVSFAWSSVTTQTLNPGTVLTMYFVYLGGTCDLTFNPTDCEVIQLVGNSINPIDVTYTDGEVPQTVLGAEVAIGTFGGAEIGEPFPVPLFFDGFGSNIGALTLNIAFDSDKLTFLDAEGDGPLINLIYYITDNVITIAWNNANNTSPIDGIPILLWFNYNGPAAADITFEPACDIQTTEAISLPVIYYDGSVIPASGANAVIGTVEAFPGNTGVLVPVSFADFPSNVGSLTFKIAYDSDKLTFQSAVGAGDLSNMLYYSDDDMIYVSWTSTAPLTGKNINDDGIALFFTYLGGGEAPLTFAAGTEITSNTAVIITTEYSNGGIIQGDSPYSVSLDMVTAYPNNQVTNTITFDGFPSGVGSMTLYVEYDDTKMTFQDAQGFNDLVNVLYYTEINPGLVSRVILTWNDTDGVDPDGSTIDLTFMYLGGGATPLVFGPGCVISDTEADPFDVSYTDGGVNFCETAVIDDQPESQTVNLGETAYFTVVSLNAESIQWEYFNVNNSEWEAIPLPSATTPTLEVVTEVFMDGVQIRARLQCGDVLTDVVQLFIRYKITGNVTYDNISATALNNCTVTLKQGVTDIATTTTDGSGFYEFGLLENGTYSIVVTSTKPWGGVSVADATLMQRHIANLPGYVLTGLRFMAGDVTNNSTIAVNDVTFVKRRIANTPPWSFNRGDWVFETPTVVISSAHILQNIKGLTAGDVNGSYTPAP